MMMNIERVKSEEQGPFHLSSLLFLGLLFDFPCLLVWLAYLLQGWMTGCLMLMLMLMLILQRVGVSVCQCVSVSVL